MAAVRRFALIFGIVFLVVGIAGFIPGLTMPHEHPDVRVTSFLGLELRLFAVNVLHNIVHLLFGVWGIAASRSIDGGRVYAKGVAIIYAILTVMGFITAGNLYTTFGLIPLYGNDIWLHALLAIVAAYFGFRSHEADEPSRLASGRHT